jgi:hypothetical protein
VAEFSGRVERAIAAAEDGRLAPSPAAMARVRDELGLPATVVLSSGQRVEVEAPAALEGLSGATSRDFERAIRHLRALSFAAGEAEAAAPPSDEAMRSLVERAYRGVGATQPGLFDRIRLAVLSGIAWVIDRLVHARGLGSILVWGVAVGLAAGLVLLLRRGTVPDRAEPRADAAEPDVDWEALAEEARRRGDLEGAVHASFRALVKALSARGIVLDEPSVTAGECRAATAGRRPATATSVAEATASFERVVYGMVAPRDEDVEVLTRAVREVHAV